MREKIRFKKVKTDNFVSIINFLINRTVTTEQELMFIYKIKKKLIKENLKLINQIILIEMIKLKEFVPSI